MFVPIHVMLFTQFKGRVKCFSMQVVMNNFVFS